MGRSSEKISTSTNRGISNLQSYYGGGGGYLPEVDYSLGVCMDWGQETVSVCPRAKQYT